MGKQQMGKQQSGFTLIELIAVIVILGILAATAVPRFVNLSDEAAVAALAGVAGAIESSSSLNHAVDIATEAGLSGLDDTFIVIDNCDDAPGLLNSAALPAGYSITVDATVIADKAAHTCVLESTKTTETADFVIVGSR